MEKTAGVLREGSRFRLAWDSFVLLLVVFSCIVIPYKLVFHHVLDVKGWLLFYLIDFLFLVDIGLNFRTTFSHKGQEVSNAKKLRAHYLKSSFSIDALSSVPFDLLFILCGGSGVGVLFLRLLRLFRVVRMFAIFRRWGSLDIANPGGLRIIKSLVFILLLTHWMACGWFHSSYAAGFPENAWAVRAGIANSLPLDQYIRSVYWAITTMTTVGYGDITPARSIEYIICSVVMLLGASVYAFIIGSIASLLGSLHAARNTQWEKIDSVSQYLRDRKVSQKLREDVRHFYEYLWARHRGQSASEFLHDLPSPLRLEIMLDLAAGILEKVPLFKHSSRHLREILLLSLHPQTYTPGSVISREGARGRELVFITEGEVEIYSEEKGVIHGVLTSGEYFGALSLLLDEDRTASVRTTGFVEALVLKKDQYLQLSKEHPEFREALKKASAENSEKMTELVLDGVVL